MLTAPGLHFSFILRLRFESDPSRPDRPAVLRGSLQPIGSTEVRYFAEWEDIARLLQVMTVADDRSEPAIGKD